MDKSSSTTTYQYQPLQQGEIRLLVLLPDSGSQQVCCRLEAFDISASLKYETISYAWGDPNDVEYVVCDGLKIQATKSLHCALQHLRYTDKERVLWADAICINQDDTQERSAQVTLMGNIYAHSQGVLIWLGEEDEQCSLAMDKIDALDSYFRIHEPGYPDDEKRWDTLPEIGQVDHEELQKDELVWKIPLIHLLSKPWFLRRWVIQELAKSPKATVVCGNKSISWTTLAEVFWSLQKSGTITSIPPEYMSWPFHLGVQSVVSLEVLRRDLIQFGGSELFSTMVSCSFYKCADPKDVLFSLLGVARDLDEYEPAGSPSSTSCYPWSGVTPDYFLTVEGVYQRFVISSIANKKSLLTLSTPYIKPEVSHLNLPSWVPDFSNLLLANGLMYMRNESGLPFKTSGESALESRFSYNYFILHVRGRQVDTIKAVIPPIDLDSGGGSEADGKAEQETIAGFDIVANSNITRWIIKCLQISQIPSDAGLTRYGLTQDRLQDFLRTLICDLTVPGDRSNVDTMLALNEWIETLFGNQELARKYEGEGTWQDYLSRLTSMDSAFFMRSSGWGFCSTEHGRMGRCLKSARPGDKVVILYGGELPYILRERAAGGWTFISSCYIHGLMDGEGMTLQLDEEEFAIH